MTAAGIREVFSRVDAALAGPWDELSRTLSRHDIQALLDHARGRADVTPEGAVTVTLAENEMLLRVPVEVDYEDDDWESGRSGYWFAGAHEFHLIADTLDERHAALMSFEADGGDPFPDGTGTLRQQMQERFEGRRETYLVAHDEEPASQGLLTGRA